MTTRSLEDLQNQIEQLVRDHLAAQRRAATAAVERAFAAVASPRKPCAPRAKTGRRRVRSEMLDIADQLYQAVRAKPGETIAVIAAELGQPAKVLSRPMVHLKRAGRVRSAGQRNLTRYFPMPNAARSA